MFPSGSGRDGFLWDGVVKRTGRIDSQKPGWHSKLRAKVPFTTPVLCGTHKGLASGPVALQPWASQGKRKMRKGFTSAGVAVASSPRAADSWAQTTYKTHFAHPSAKMLPAFEGTMPGQTVER
eukprot:gnl/MRDRNA2_/MRDRNA2_118694_c0_seq1.p1 gnl/MRDRNA2_/MRDRNA2_118694_c0~~gnl/MRDRNA2_/MRDRNA2_118694_c0_seq1.p1  ORF type:complete len:123 (-),score=18.17 gnl/MRDRNA2_/MRDRNA2_118694_c0_seq1:62-430(-)